jgi:hypothetical protein
VTNIGDIMGTGLWLTRNKSLIAWPRQSYRCSFYQGIGTRINTNKELGFVFANDSDLVTAFCERLKSTSMHIFYLSTPHLFQSVENSHQLLLSNTIVPTPSYRFHGRRARESQYFLSPPYPQYSALQTRYAAPFALCHQASSQST